MIRLKEICDKYNFLRLFISEKQLERNMSFADINVALGHILYAINGTERSKELNLFLDRGFSKETDEFLDLVKPEPYYGLKENNISDYYIEEDEIGIRLKGLDNITDTDVSDFVLKFIDKYITSTVNINIHSVYNVFGSNKITFKKDKYVLEVKKRYKEDYDKAYKIILEYYNRMYRQRAYENIRVLKEKRCKELGVFVYTKEDVIELLEKKLEINKATIVKMMLLSKYELKEPVYVRDSFISILGLNTFKSSYISCNSLCQQLINAYPEKMFNIFNKEKYNIIMSKRLKGFEKTSMIWLKQNIDNYKYVNYNGRIRIEVQ